MSSVSSYRLETEMTKEQQALKDAADKVIEVIRRSQCWFVSLCLKFENHSLFAICHTKLSSRKLINKIDLLIDRMF